MMYLPKEEIRIYFLCHITFILYAIHTVWAYRQEISSSGLDYMFIPGWLAGGQREIGDDEWENFKVYVLRSIPWLISHVLLSRLLRLADLYQLLPWGYSLLGLLYLVTHYGLLVTGLVFLNIIPYFCIPRRWGNNAVLLLTIYSLAIANASKWCFNNDDWIMGHTKLTDFKLYEVLVVYGWTTLKCISFSLDAQDEMKDDDGGDFQCSHFLGYVFYIPTLYLGPPMVYSRFKACYHQRDNLKQKDGIALIKTFLKDISRVIFWFLVLEFTSHFLYLMVLASLPDILDKFNIISLFGYGYLLGQHFQVKYVTTYGFAGAFAKLDGIDPPPMPICVARVHKYSDMWKHFDRGLYEFLVRCIYSRLQSRSSGLGQRLLATLVTFLFIYMWHGYYIAILVWSALNALVILLETAVKYVQKLRQYDSWMTSNFSRNNRLRIEAIFGTHLLILAVISNFFFLANYDVGMLFWRRTYQNDFVNYFLLSTSLVFMYFTSEYCKRAANLKVDSVN